MSEQPLPLYKTADVTAMDRMAIDDLGISGYLLMTRAAQASLRLLTEHFDGARSLLVLCGAGNNGGDGYVLARLAADQGFRVTLCDVASAKSLTGIARTAYQDFVTAGGVCTPYNCELISSHDIVVDGLLGTGLARAVGGVFKQVIEDVNSLSTPVLSLDTPSGLVCDSGVPMPIAIKADITVTFVARKHGLYTGYGAAYCGQRFLDTLSIPSSVARSFSPSAYLISDREVRRMLPPRPADTHKGQCGKVLLVGGGKGMAGAAVLAGNAALRVGAGLVKVACSPDSASAIVNRRPELMTLSVEHIQQLEQVIEWCDVIAVGPGLGRDRWAREMFYACLSANKPTVVDADALHLLAAVSPKPSGVEQAQVTASASRIITPHVGEAATLLGVSTAQIRDDREGACRKLAAQYDCVAILKGAGTAVCSKTSPIFFCAQGNPGMATAGTGDVLTGVTIGLWAQQSDRAELAMDVALAAVKVHAESGDRAANAGMRGMIASDLIDQLRAAVNNR